MWWGGRRRKRKDVQVIEDSSRSRGRESDDTESLDRLSSHEGPKHPRRIDSIKGGAVTSLAFFIDGRYIVFGCRDGSIQQWRIGDSCEIEPVMKSDGMVNSIAASPDGKWIVSGGVDCMVTIWNAANHQKVSELSQQQRTSVTSLDVSPDSSCVAAGWQNGSVAVWCLECGERIAGPLKHQDSQVSSVKFSPTGDRFASACTSYGDSIRIWNSRTGDQLVDLSTGSRPTYSIAWSCDGQRLFAGGPRGSIRCFSIASRSTLSEFGTQSDSVTSLCISNNDRFLIAGSLSDCSLSLWDANTFQQIRTDLFQHSEVLTTAISPDDRHLVTGTLDEKISIWSLDNIVPTAYFFLRLAPSLKDSDPFTFMGQVVHEAWRLGKLKEADELLSREIKDPDCPELAAYSLVNRALVRARLCKWDEALEDVQRSIGIRVSLTAFIAKGFALFGQGNRQEAMEAFDIALHGCDDDARPFVELFKLIILFEVQHHNGVEITCCEIDSTDCDPYAKSLRTVVRAQILVLLAERSLTDHNYAKAIQLLTEAQDLGSFVQAPELRTISLIFGWSFDGLEYVIQQKKCIALLASGRVREAVDSVLGMQTHLKEEATNREEVYKWLAEFKKRCFVESEGLGETAMCNADYISAVVWYSTALDLNLASPEHILMRRNEAYAAMGSWEDAVTGSDEVISRGGIFTPQAYDMKHHALKNLERYDEIIKMLNELPDGELRSHHTRARAAIDEAVEETLHNVPLRMIDTRTGYLCEEARLRSIFEGDPLFGNLLVSMTECMDIARTKRVVKEFFRYVMFSHRWQDREPLRSDVGDQSVYNLPTDDIPTVSKLQTFCRTAGKAGYRWAWSDTCCIDQNIQREFEKSINSMYRWYRHSSLTLVYLWDVWPSLLPGGLTKSAWITRGWTLQELLAPTVILFLHADWTPYLSDLHPNHKESDAIMGEIASAVGAPANDLLSFHPSSDDVRWKLKMASKRDTKVPEDSAYCLFGIFNVVMPVIPGETRQQAVARLLQEVVTCSKSGDVGCLAWVGEPSEQNSCLPTQVKAYQGSCHTPASIGEEEIQRLALASASSFTKEKQAQAQSLRDRLSRQRRAEFAGWHLRLPCIVFAVTALDVDSAAMSSANVYIATATGLEATRICTADKFSPKGLLLAFPWIHELLYPDPPHARSDAETDFDVVSGGASETQPDSFLHEKPENLIRSHTPGNDRALSNHLDARDEKSRSSMAASSPPSSSSGPSDERMRALRFAARLRQPMTALLLSPQRHGAYNRVATDHEIIIKLCKEVSLDSLAVTVVEVI